MTASRVSGKLTLEAEMIVHGAGRVPEIDDVNLDAAGVAWDRKGVKVNEYLQSVSNPAVYAAGDAAASGNPPLTPVAGYEGKIVAANLLKGNHEKANLFTVAMQSKTCASDLKKMIFAYPTHASNVPYML